MDIWKFIVDYTPQIALIAPTISTIISVIVGRNNLKNEKKRQIQYINECNKQQQDKLDKFLREERKASYKKVFNQGFIKPYFVLKQNGEINRIDKGYIFSFSLRNIGMASAVDVQLIQENNKDFFECGIKGAYHNIHDYFDKNYATKEEEICFSVIATRIDEETPYEVEFQIIFKDILGRRYKQKFRFLYKYNIMKTISKKLFIGNVMCVEDVAIKDIDFYKIEDIMR